MYCSRSLSVSDRLMSLSDKSKEKTITSCYSYDFVDVPESEGGEKDVWYRENLFEFQDHLDNEDSSKTNVINKESCDNNLRETLNELNDELNNLKFDEDCADDTNTVVVPLENDDNKDDFVNKNSQVVSQLSNVSLEENNFIKDLNHNDNKVNNGDVLEDDLRLFNSNIYWYISPDMPLDSSIIAGKEPSRSESLNTFKVSTPTM